MYLNGKLLCEHPFLEAATGVEQHVQGNVAIFGDMDFHHVPHLEIVGYGADGALVGLKNFEGDARSMGQ